MASMDCDKKLAKALAKGNADEVRRASAEVSNPIKISFTPLLSAS